MDSRQEKLVTFENKVLRNVFGPTRENGEWRKWNGSNITKKLRDLYNAPDAVAEAKSRQMRWVGHIFRREDKNLLKQVWKENPVGRRPPGRPKKRWKVEVSKDMEKMRAIEEDAEDRENWRHLVGKAKYHLRYRWPWEEE